MTVQEIREQVEAAKAKAQKRFDRDMGEGAYERLGRYSRSDENRRNLNAICDKLDV